MSKGKDFCHLPEISGKCRKKILDTLTKVGLDAVKAASRKVGHKTAGAIGELMGKKIADEIWNENLSLMWIHEMLKK